MTPHREDFARWLDDPVTGFVMRSLLEAAEANKATWIATSWENGGGSREMLAELRTRADAYRAIAETSYEGFCDMLGETPNEE